MSFSSGGGGDAIREHWEQVYRQRGPTSVSWYQPDARVSQELIKQAGAVESVIDVGGGASVLVHHLLDAGIGSVTVLDVAPAGMRRAQERLGARAAHVRWVEHDVLTWQPDRRYDLWHDRAVFHFLVDPADRAAYRAVLGAALRPGGYAIVATFAAHGPTHCSGLPVARYGATDLAAELPGLRLVASRTEQHQTPSGAVQPFTWVLMQA